MHVQLYTDKNIRFFFCFGERRTLVGRIINIIFTRQNFHFQVQCTITLVSQIEKHETEEKNYLLLNQSTKLDLDCLYLMLKEMDTTYHELRST